jgi:hypothetical protein
MSRKDYEKFARMIQKEYAEVVANSGGPDSPVAKKTKDRLHHTALVCSRVFEEDNPSFNRDRFMQACGLGE